jgi:GxxExxY protein
VDKNENAETDDEGIAARFEFDPVSNRVIGAAIEVHKKLGPGFLESVYEEALCLELTARDIPFERQRSLQIFYNGQAVGEHRLDLFVAGCLVVELKAVRQFEDVHLAIMLSYLKATNCEVGLLLNFGTPTLAVKRVVRRH